MLADNDGAEEPTATSSVINVVRRRAAPLVTPQRAQRMIPIAEATGHSRDRAARTLAPRRRSTRRRRSPSKLLLRKMAAAARCPPSRDTRHKHRGARHSGHPQQANIPCVRQHSHTPRVKKTLNLHTRATFRGRLHGWNGRRGLGAAAQRPAPPPRRPAVARRPPRRRTPVGSRRRLVERVALAP